MGVETTMWAIVGARLTREQARAFARAAGMPDGFEGDAFLDAYQKHETPRLLKIRLEGQREPAYVAGLPLLHVPAEFGRMAERVPAEALARAAAQVAPLLAAVEGTPAPALLLLPTVC